MCKHLKYLEEIREASIWQAYRRAENARVGESKGEEEEVYLKIRDAVETALHQMTDVDCKVSSMVPVDDAIDRLQSEGYPFGVDFTAAELMNDGAAYLQVWLKGMRSRQVRISFDPFEGRRQHGKISR